MFATSIWLYNLQNVEELNRTQILLSYLFQRLTKQRISFPLIFASFDFDITVSLQVVTSVPTHPFPKKLVSAATSEIEMNERQKEAEDETVDDLAPRGQILWIRGLTRLQHQVGPLGKTGCSAKVI